jgi:VWFA-related protein
MKQLSGGKVLAGLLLLPWLSGVANAANGASTANPANPANAADRLTESTQVTLVEIPVQVVRDGEPVRGLQASDFEIVEGRQPHPITGFDMVDLAAPENRLLSADIPAAAKRHFLLLFDLANSKPKTIARSRAAVMESLFKTLTASDLTAVAVYSPFSGLRLVQGFTSDLRQIAKAVADLGMGLVDRHPAAGGAAPAAAAVANALQELNLAAQDMQQSAATMRPGETVSQFVRGEVQAQIATSLIGAMQTELLQDEGRIAQYQHDEISQAKSTLAPYTLAFADLARMMDAVSGRKLVVLFSEGFDSTVLSGDESDENQVSLAHAALSGGAAAIDSDERFGNTGQSNMMEKMLEQFRRSDCVIEAIDISGLRGMDLDANAQHSGESSLALMAKDTGGEVFRNSNDLGRAMDEMAKRTSVTYVLSFQPAGLKADGSYHPIKVRLKDAPRGTHVTYRSGFYAPLPYGQRKPMEKMLAVTDELTGANQAGSIATAILAEPFRTGAEKAYVPVFIEVDGKTLLDGLTGKILPAEIYAYAVDANGSIRDFFNQTLQIDIEKAGPLLRQGGLKYFAHLELPAGKYALRVLLRNGATGAYGKRTVLIEVPAFGPQEAVLLAPLFPEAQGHWAVLRESPHGGLNDTAYPFVVGQQAFVPASRPVLPAGQESPLALVGYNLGSDFKTVAKVQSADGHDLRDCPLRLGALVPGSGGNPDVYKAFFSPPQDLAPGNYRLVVTGSGGAQSAASLFTIGGAAP